MYVSNKDLICDTFVALSTSVDLSESCIPICSATSSASVLPFNLCSRALISSSSFAAILASLGIFGIVSCIASLISRHQVSRVPQLENMYHPSVMKCDEVSGNTEQTLLIFRTMFDPEKVTLYFFARSLLKMERPFSARGLARLGMETHFRSSLACLSCVECRCLTPTSGAPLFIWIIDYGPRNPSKFFSWT